MQERSLINDNILIIAIFAASFTISLFAPSSYVIKSNETSVADRVDVIQECSFDDLQPSNSFLTYEIFFERSNISKPLHTAIVFTSTVELYDNEQNKDTKGFTGSIYPITPNRQSSVTGAFRLFIDQDIQYTKSSIRVKLLNLPENIKSITLIGKHGNEKYTIYQLFVRGVYTILSFIEAIRVLKRKSQKEFYHQLYFLFFLLSINPLMFIHYYYPIRIFIIIDNLGQALFDSFFRFYLISLLSDFRGSLTSQLPTAFFFAVYLLTKICHNMSCSLKGVDFLTAVSTRSLPFLSFELGLEMTYITWTIVAIASSFSKAKTSYEKSILKPIYTVILVVCTIYVFKRLSTSLLSTEPINTDFLNFVIYYAITYLIGFYGSRNFSKLKISKFLHDDEKPEPLSAVFENTDEKA